MFQVALVLVVLLLLAYVLAFALIAGIVVGIGWGIYKLIVSRRSIRLAWHESVVKKVTRGTIDDHKVFRVIGYLCSLGYILSQSDFHKLENLLRELDISGAGRDSAIKGFNQGSKLSFDVERTQLQIASSNLSHASTEQLIYFMSQVVSELIERNLSVRQQQVLFHMAQECGLHPHETASIIKLQQQRQKPQTSVVSSSETDTASAYAILRLNPHASKSELQRTYRKMKRRYDPSRLSRKASEAQRRAAEQHFEAIQDAWNVVNAQHDL